MEVYVELAILENFLLDGVLLYLALKVGKTKVRVWRLLLAAAIGAAEAVVFPLFPLPVWAAYLVKGVGGVLPCLIAVHGKKFKPYLVTTLAFFVLTFALGGLLTAIYTFFDISYLEGNGYLVEQAPVGLVVATVIIFAVAVVFFSKRAYRYRKVRQNLVDCVLEARGREVRWQGYADSGNRLEFQGKPVCVASSVALFALFGRNLKEAGRITVGTVNGKREAPVFECEKLVICTQEKTYRREDVYLTVGEVGKDFQLILNTALMEA